VGEEPEPRVNGAAMDPYHDRPPRSSAGGEDVEIEAVFALGSGSCSEPGPPSMGF